MVRDPGDRILKELSENLPEARVVREINNAGASDVIVIGTSPFACSAPTVNATFADPMVIFPGAARRVGF